LDFLKQYEIYYQKAITDIIASEILFASDNSHIDHHVICFHLQQAIEKLLKSYLSHQDIHYPKTHDTSFLFDKIKLFDSNCYEDFNDLSDLDIYAVEARYDFVVNEHIDVCTYIKKVQDLSNYIKSRINFNTSI